MGWWDECDQAKKAWISVQFRSIDLLHRRPKREGLEFHIGLQTALFFVVDGWNGLGLELVRLTEGDRRCFFFHYHFRNKIALSSAMCSVERGKTISLEYI